MITDERLFGARILIVDDEPSNLRLLDQILAGHGYTDVSLTDDPSEAIRKFGEAEPDLVLLDYRMPGMNGLEVMECFAALQPAESFVPILMLTADSTNDIKTKALAGGANDFLTKPFDYQEVLLRIRNLLVTRMLHEDLRNQNDSLDEKVRSRTRELALAQLETLDRLARAAEYRDDDTGQHARRVGEMSARLGAALGLPGRQVKLLELAAPLHDLGKIAIPDAILLKPGKLSPDEWEIMKSHTTIGAGLLSGSQSGLLSVAERIALSHHERWDGTGYPDGLGGDKIPLPARIVAVVDVFDALASDRPYRDAWPIERTIDHLREERGKHFDPRVLDAFLTCLEADGIIPSDEPLAAVG